MAAAYPRSVGRLVADAFDLAILLMASTFDHVTVRMLERQLSVGDEMVVRHVSHLVGLGYLERSRDPYDHRRRLLTVTPKGHRLLASAPNPPTTPADSSAKTPPPEE